MAHHQHSNHDRTLAAQGLSSGSHHSSPNMFTAGDDDLASSDADEPPDSRIHFAKLVTPSSRSFTSNSDTIISPLLSRNRKESLLTQALLSSPELNPMSDAEAPVLTSDGGLTSPARTTTPSPPTPTVHHTGLAIFSSMAESDTDPKSRAETLEIAPKTGADRLRESSVEAGLGRKRCISFACGRQSASQKNSGPSAKEQGLLETSLREADPPKRPCMLKFACPMRPSRTESVKPENIGKTVRPPINIVTTTEAKAVGAVSGIAAHEHQDSTSTTKNSLAKDVLIAAVTPQSWKGQVFNRIDFQKSEATRFHEFAGPFNAEDEWTNEQTAYRQKITINDTLRKENAIRKLAEEAEEEALEEEDDEYVAGDEIEDLDVRNDDEDISTDGNETDDEEGFAESDEESDGGSDYQFWTPGLTTAATSTDQLEHIRPVAHRVASDSSIESTINIKKNEPTRPRHMKSPRMRPGTPDLPDSSDFVVGTIDEDRPLEDAYMSCLDERRRSRHRLIPQDIDPSFPTSDREVDNDDEEEDDVSGVDDEPEWVTGRPEAPEGGKLPPSRKSSSSTNRTTSSTSSPKRMQSPTPKRLHSPPPKRAVLHRSPPPRRLFGQSTHRLRSPPPAHRKLTSPPSSRRPSISGSPPNSAHGIDMPHLAQRPNLTHTSSLPRTPNPFWGQHRKSRFHGADTPSAGTSPKSLGQSPLDVHSRGPIDIVQGLEAKRQRRKEKFWRQHCRAGGKDKRKCQPGKGAERMKELGLEMAERRGQRAQLVLSV